MNDGWLDAAHALAEDALSGLLDVQARLDALPVHAPCRAALARRAGDLAHRIAAACGVLDTYAATAPADEAEEDDPLPSPVPFAVPAIGEAAR